MSQLAANAARERQMPSMADRAVGLYLSHGLPHFTARDDNARVEGIPDAAQDNFRISKEALKAPEYTDIVNFDNRTYWYVRDNLVLPHWFRRGEYLLPVAMIDRVEAYLTERQAQRGHLIDAFMAVYEERKAEARERLGPLYDESEYPSAADVRARFNMEWDYPAFGVAGALEYFKKDIWQREQAKLQEKGERAIDAVTLLLRAQVKALVDHWLAVLAGDGDGKPKVFKSASLDKLRDMLTDLKLKNITDDHALDVQVDALIDALGAADANELRKDHAYRAVVAGKFEQVKLAVDKLAVEKPERRIRF